MSATIDWVADDESNPPRGDVSWLKIGPEVVALRFKGAEAGQGSSWAGSIVLKRTVVVQTITGHYEEIPDPKMRASIKIMPYTVIGRFSDDACKSFTGKWTGGVDIVSVYEINIDID
jgi:hypothetical protein